MSLMVSSESKPQHTFDSTEMGAIAHHYRGEVYRSTIWRTRLDNTTNWAIVTMGIALSTTFSSPEASPLPLLLVGLLIAVFLGMEARRYRYFNVWRARARWMEMNFYAPIFTGETRDDSWQAIPGWIVLMVGLAYNFGWLAFALGTMWFDQRQHGAAGDKVAMG